MLEAKGVAVCCNVSESVVVCCRKGCEQEGRGLFGLQNDVLRLRIRILKESLGGGYTGRVKERETGGKGRKRGSAAHTYANLHIRMRVHMHTCT